MTQLKFFLKILIPSTDTLGSEVHSASRFLLDISIVKTNVIQLDSEQSLVKNGR